MTWEKRGFLPRGTWSMRFPGNFHGNFKSISLFPPHAEKKALLTDFWGTRVIHPLRRRFFLNQWMKKGTPPKLRWNLNMIALQEGKPSSKPSFSGSILIFWCVHLKIPTIIFWRVFLDRQCKNHRSSEHVAVRNCGQKGMGILFLPSWWQRLGFSFWWFLTDSRILPRDSSQWKTTWWENMFGTFTKDFRFKQIQECDFFDHSPITKLAWKSTMNLMDIFFPPSFDGVLLRFRRKLCFCVCFLEGNFKNTTLDPLIWANEKQTIKPWSLLTLKLYREKTHTPRKLTWLAGKSTIWRWISSWKLGDFQPVILVFRGVVPLGILGSLSPSQDITGWDL